MWSVEHRVEARASRSDLWRVWTDLERMPEWDPRCEWARLDGPFKDGQTGRAKFRGSPAGDYRVTGVEPGRAYSLEVGLPLARTRYDHELEDAADGATLVRERVTVRGPLAPILSLALRRRMDAYLPGKLERLADRAGADA